MLQEPHGGMRKIALLDPSTTSANLGDEIIMQAAHNILLELFPHAFYVKLPTQEFWLWQSYRIHKECDYMFVCGSNLLKSKMLWRNQWKIAPWDFLLRKRCILMGCGWRHYQAPPDWYSRYMLRRILADRFLHSTRDNYSAQHLRSIGLTNVRNTACMTMWKLNATHCASIPTARAPRAITTVTGYNPDPQADRAYLEILLQNYEEVVLWPQQPDDFAYVQQLNGGRINYLAPNLAAYTEFLRDNNVDYVGSRLHGGIRALQMGKRSLILAVDNRAMEIANNTGLSVVKRENVTAIDRWIKTPEPTRIRLPNEAIAEWLGQFKTL
jgi:polysaccharide pyruvyl transferase WcaK-like protein